MGGLFISGVAGFVGSALAEALLSQGHAVFGVDNLSDYYDPEFKRRRLQLLAKHEGFHFWECDIEDGERLLAVAESAGALDGVIHLAARAGVRESVRKPSSFLKTNVYGTLNVLEVCRQLHIPKLVNASSSSVYGGGQAGGRFCEESDTRRPLSPYAASKSAAEDLCHSYHHLYALDVSVLRFFTVYGPSGRPDMAMFRLIRSIAEGRTFTVFGDGNQSRDFTNVEDIVRGIIAALNPVGYRVFNLGADHPVQLKSVIKAIEDLTKREAILQFREADPSDVASTWADITRATTELDWRPQVDLHTGIARCLDWHLENRHWLCVV